MKLIIIAIMTITLPWGEMFRREMSLNEEVAWAAMDISGMDMKYSEGTRAGVWGLTPAVARKYGLRVDQWVDERYDVKRATEAAARYTKELIAKYGNDTARAVMVLVNTPFRQVGDVRWVTPGRTPRYVSETRIEELTEAYNITDDERACRIAEADSIRAAMQRQMRAQTMRQQTVVETEQQTSRQASQQIGQQASQQASQQRVHIVNRGETLSHIARRYGCTVNQIKEWNGLKSDIIQIGQKLKIRK